MCELFWITSTFWVLTPSVTYVRTMKSVVLLFLLIAFVATQQPTTTKFSTSTTSKQPSTISKLATNSSKYAGNSTKLAGNSTKSSANSTKSFSTKSHVNSSSTTVKAPSGTTNSSSIRAKAAASSVKPSSSTIKQFKTGATKPSTFKDAKPSMPTTTKRSFNVATSSGPNTPQPLKGTTDESFQSWKAKYSKVYASAVLESQAKEIYAQNVAKIADQNVRKSSFKLEANYNADMNEQQIRKFRQGFKLANNSKTAPNAVKSSKFAKKFAQSQNPSDNYKSQSSARNKSGALDYTRFVAGRLSRWFNKRKLCRFLVWWVQLRIREYAVRFDSWDGSVL